MSRSMYWLEEELRQVISTYFGFATQVHGAYWDDFIYNVAKAIEDGHLTISGALAMDGALRGTR